MLFPGMCCAVSDDIDDIVCSSNFSLCSHKRLLQVFLVVILLYELPDHDVKFLWLVQHDHVSRQGDQLQVRPRQRALHLAHLHEGHERVLEAVNQESGYSNAAVKGCVAY